MHSKESPEDERGRNKYDGRRVRLPTADVDPLQQHLRCGHPKQDSRCGHAQVRCGLHGVGAQRVRTGCGTEETFETTLTAIQLYFFSRGQLQNHFFYIDSSCDFTWVVVCKYPNPVQAAEFAGRFWKPLRWAFEDCGRHFGS